MEEQTINAVVIVAAGRGARAGNNNGPKQYRNLGNRTVLARTIDAFVSHPEIHKVVVCIHTDDADLYKKSIGEHAKLLAPVPGGATRQLSALAGLEALKFHSPSNVLIHDAARPFVDPATIKRVLARLGSAPAALPAMPLADTIKRGNENGLISETISRDGLNAAQTPQGFRYEEILNAHRRAEAEGRNDFTDDSALAEWANMPVVLVEGNPANTKLTTAQDIEDAQMRIASLPDIRTGHGYDVHQFAEGDKIRLCGVDIPFSKKLSGHSDADVGLHALTDALLACIADGDIGSHFPPSDPQWKDADSNQFLAHAASLVRAANGYISHCDVTLVCEAPKIGPHRDAMRSAISAVIDIEAERISVKATTSEKIGFVGRKEGMTAFATATVVMGNS